MRLMKWSYADLMACPESYLDVIAKEVMRENREAQAAARSRSRRR